MNFDDLTDDRDEADITGSTPQGSAPQGAPQPSFDELTDDRDQQSSETMAGPQSQGPLSFDDLQDDRQGQGAAPGRQQPSSGGDWTQAGSFAAGVAKGAVPTTGGLAAGLYAGAAASPFVTPVGGVLVGLGVGIGTSWLADIGQDKLLALMGLDKPLAEAREANPTTFDVGQMAPAAALLRPTGTMLQRGVGAGIGVAAEGGLQALHGEFDPTKLAMAGAFGAALPNPNRLGSKVIAAGESVPGRYRGGNKGGENPNPDVKAVEEAAPAEPDIVIANDQPQVAGGVALEQPPTPKVEGAGNPEGAPMAAREAARPNEPARNYSKTEITINGKRNPELERATDSKVIDTEPLKGDIKAALEADKAPGEQVQQPAPGTDVLPAREAAPTNPEPYSMGIDPQRALSRMAAAENETPRQAEERRLQEIKNNAVPSDRPVETGLPEPAKPVPADRAGPEAPVASGLTPEEINVAVRARRELAKLGYTRVLDAIDNAKLNPKQVAEKLAQAYNATQSASGEAVGRKTGEVRTEAQRQKLSTGALAASKGDAARKEAAVKLVTDFYAEHGPGSENGKAIDPLDPAKTAENKQWIKDTWAKALEANGGRDPVMRSKDQYVPLKQGEAHTEAYQWLKALKAAATGQNQRQFATMHTAKGMGAVSRETGRVEGDIAHRPQINEVGGEIETATQPSSGPRETFERIPLREGKDNTFAKQHNEVVDWLNDLPGKDYDILADHYKENLRTEVIDMMEPHDTMSEMMDVLKKSGRRATADKTPKGEITSEVETAPKPVDVPQLPARKEPANPGRVLDKNSDEFKRLAAQYNAEPVKARVSAEEKLAQLGESERTTAKLNDDRTAIDGSSEKAIMDKIKSFVGDESGAGPVAPILQRMFGQPANPSSPAAAPGVVDYVNDLSGKFAKLAAETKNRKVELMGHLAASADQKLSPYEHRQIALAEQNNKVEGLPQKLRDYYDNYVAPIRSEAMQIMRDFKDLNTQEGLGYEIPNLNAVTTKAYQPRYQVDKLAFNRKETDAFDPFTGAGLGDWAANLENRKLFALENGTQRMVIEVGGNADTGFTANVIRPGLPGIHLRAPASFTGQLGDVLNLSVKGKKGQWTVDQATTKEIETATGGTKKFVENATWAWTKMLDDVSRAYENAKLTASIKNDPQFRDLTTTDKEVARERGWSSTVSTHLPDFATVKGKPLYMPDNMRWVFDDYHRPGFGGVSGEGIERLRNFNVALLKVFNTNAPLVHVLNELDLGIVSRGFKWLSPKANYDLAVSAPKAFKSVNSQDALQREMRLAGVNPMLASVGMRSMYETAAKNFGMEIMKNHSKWDPVARAWGVSTKELGQKIYDLSSDVTWRLSDYITTMRYMEEKRGGWSNEDAAKRVNQFMSDYHLKTTVMGSRAVQQLLAEPAITAFGRYKAGVFRSLSSMTANAVKGDPMLREQARKAGFGAAMAELKSRNEAIGQWLVMGAMGYMVYPAISHLMQKATDNEGTEMRPRGVTSVADAAKNIVTGEKDAAAMFTRAWTPAPLMNMAIEAKGNKDFTGKPIVPQGEWPGVIPDAAANVAEYGLQQMIPPYGTVSKNYARPEGSFGSGVGALALDQIGVGTPSEASQKRQGRIEKINAQAEKARTKRPGGMIPDFINRLTD